MIFLLFFVGCTGVEPGVKSSTSSPPSPASAPVTPAIPQQSTSAQAQEVRPSAPPAASASQQPVTSPLPVTVAPGAAPAVQPATPGRPATPPLPVAQAPGAPGATPAAPPKGKGVVFKFDNADLYEVIRTMAEILKISYVIDPRVKGTVNINTSGAVSQDEVYPILLSILKMNGATIVKKDSIYEIVPFSEGKRLPVLSGDTKRGPGEDRFVIEIIRPSFIPITELEKVVRPFLSDEKELISYPQNNMLIVVDLASNIQKIRDLIGMFDVDIFTDKTIQIYPIVNSDANEVAKELERIFTSLEIPSKSGRGVGIAFTPITRLNAVLVISSIPGILDRVDQWIKELDRAPTEESRVNVYVYYVQNSKAKDLADVLKQVYAKGKDLKVTTEEPKPATPTPTPTPTTPRTTRPTTPATPAAAPAKEAAVRVAEGEVNIVVDESNNALVIRALYRDYLSMIETIKKLDIYPKQVLIEVLLATITLDDTTRYGLEWMKFVDSLNKGEYEQTVRVIGDVGTSVIPGIGISYSIVEAAGKFAASIKAAADEHRLNVVSSPHILASNNKEAKIQIGAEAPIFTSTYTTTGTTGESSTITGTIEYKDIGIILTVTPRVSDAGLITLDIQIEDSTATTVKIGSENDLLSVPAFKKKVAKTTLSVLQGQMIVIGGLISDTKDNEKSGIPYLSKIPVLGALFGVHANIINKEETILLLTPHIITDASQSRTVTDEFRSRVRGIQTEINRIERENAPK
jgi:general secretion pathway protein D